MGENRYAYRILVGKPERKRPLDLDTKKGKAIPVTGRGGP
jgi:hypothetical protein